MSKSIDDSNIDPVSYTSASRSRSSEMKLYLTSTKRSCSCKDSNSEIDQRKLINLLGINLSISIKSINEITNEADGIGCKAKR